VPDADLPLPRPANQRHDRPTSAAPAKETRRVAPFRKTRTAKPMRPLSLAPPSLAAAITLAASLVAAAASIVCFDAALSPVRAQQAAPVSEADITNFYQNPSPARLAQLMAYFNTLAQSGKPFPQPPVIGFLAAAFQKYPSDIDTLIPTDLSLPMLEIVGYSLRLAGQDAKARVIAERLKSRGAAAPDFTQVPAGLDALSADGPNEFDMLWGASFATGDPRYCSKILAKFAAVANADGNAEDILAIAKTAGTGADLHWVTDKRGVDKARELSIMSSALWSLNSNAQQHEFVRKAVGDYIQAHPAEPASKTLIALARNYGHYDIKQLITVTGAPPGKHSATINIAYLSQILDDLGRHASTYPPHFDSADDRQRAEHDLSAISNLLDPLSADISHNPPLLLRLALLHAFGHNLDIPDSSQKAVAAFTTLLNLTPNDPQANFRYGVFLATTTKNAEGIPYLEKAKSLGIVNAEYWLGLSYQLTGNKAKAIENLESYVKRVPNDENAARMLDAIRNGKVEVKALKPTP
jgi:tetratricopeptide (TPR) repeat protein